MLDVNALVHLTLPAQHCVIILQGLDELPHRVSRAVVDEVRRQIAEEHPAAFDQPPAAPPPVSNGHDARE